MCFAFGSLSLAQTVDSEYLNPKMGTGNPYKYLRFGTSSAYYAGIMWNNTPTEFGNGNDFSIFTYGNRDITIWTGTGNFIVFPTQGGNVGIGKNNPTSKLEVNGTIKAKEVNITAIGWPDFVFRPDYDLMPLNEVENFIQENGHLPNIPREAEVMEKGVNLGEINAKLLEKVEELTLYLIHQQKELESQKLIITEQSKNIGLLLKQMEHYSIRE
nr:hypothetical protein [Cytophagales bacterium]